VAGLTYSPVKGPNGNIEYLIYLSKNKERASEELNIDQTVLSAHEKL